MIDLHAHSTRSDGRLTPGTLVARAAEAGVTTFALTDHDTTDGLADARAAADAHGMCFVNGVEISVTWQRRTLHIVGLAFDVDDAGLGAGLARLQHTRRERAERIAHKLEKCGVADALPRAQALAGDGQITRPHFARLLIEDGVCRDNAQAFKRHLRPGRDAHVAVEWAPLEDAVAWIQGAGGIAVLAHPFGYGFSAVWRQRAIAAFAQAGGDALEISTGTTDRQQEITAARNAAQHGLAGSLGSDFHAPEQFWLGLGRLRALPGDLPAVWQDRRFPGAGAAE
ncbi:phosphoesterase [Salinisphaera orenii MK-B5]|uniref:Phosphoesterase n=1 Tax=Salinisphaera orenii MK-B5 TaxID=856730 RepID=A0A423PMM9_9GAMM|nr:phosphoesterase [Salinisphaera orenii MK-B5]